MKTIIFTLTFGLLTTVSFAQNQNKQSSPIQQRLYSENTIYQLFPTQNFWTFLKLDTRNGKIWQVHFSVKDTHNTGELILNPLSLVSEENEINGRFTLYPTENMYNFLLLDQIAGTVFQIQWSMDTKNRGIISVIMPID